MAHDKSQDRITIFREAGPAGIWIVIINGLIYELGWDEMLGQVAAFTLTGKPLFGGFPIGDPTRGRWWQPAPKQLTEGEK